MTTIITEQGRWANSVVDERGRRVFSNGLNERGRRVFGLVATPAVSHLTVQLNDNLTISDNPLTASVTNGAVHLTVQLNDTLTISDNPITKQRSGHVTLNENLNLNDSASSVDTSGASRHTASLNDNLTFTDSMTTKRSGHVSLSDSISLSDSETAHVTIGGTTIQFKRGNEANLPTLHPGEPAFTLDSQKLFIGTPSNGNVQILSLLVVSNVVYLPTASATYRFVFAGVLGGNGGVDSIYVCKKLANGTYAWVETTL